MFNESTRIAGRGTGNPEEIYRWSGTNDPELLAYLDTVYELAPPLGINPDIVVGQSHEETGGWTSDAWKASRNPAGIGVTDDSKRNWYDFRSGDIAAKAHVAHLGLYLGVHVPADLIQADPRWAAAMATDKFGSAQALDDLTMAWAIDGDYATKIASRLNMMARAGLIAEEAQVAKHKVYVLLVSGHNSVGDKGNPVERALTPNLVRAYQKALDEAGIPNEWVNPALTPGGLDGLASLTARRIRDVDAELVLALDLHFNMAESAVHVIVPHNRKANGSMLSTAIVAGRVQSDVMENNTLDVKLAEALARAIVAANPGMRLWGSTGVMREDQTGVGADGYRLAMMAYSAPYRAKAVRVTIEHGGTNDAKREKFYERCAFAAVSAIKTVLAGRLSTTPPPVEVPPVEEPPTGDPGSPSLLSVLFGEANGIVYDPSPLGVVSTLWRDRGNETGRWPRLIDFYEQDGNKFYVFGDGSVIATAPGQSSQYLSIIEEGK